MCERRASHSNYGHEGIVKGFPVGITNLKLSLAYDVVLCVWDCVCAPECAHRGQRSMLGVSFNRFPVSIPF